MYVAHPDDALRRDRHIFAVAGSVPGPDPAVEDPLETSDADAMPTSARACACHCHASEDDATKFWRKTWGIPHEPCPACPVLAAEG